MQATSRPVNQSQIVLGGGRPLLTAGLGKAVYVTEQACAAVSAMEGFLTCTEIAGSTGIPLDALLELCSWLENLGMIAELDKWNRLRWCRACGVYLTAADGICQCGRLAPLIPLSPPCDTWILFPEEQAMVGTLAREQLGVEIDEQAFLLGNWAVRDTTARWEIVHEGRLALTVLFNGESRDTWRVISGDRLGKRLTPPAGSYEREEYLAKLSACNGPSLTSREQESLAIVESTARLFPSTPLVYVSGGKESIVMTHLFRLLGLAANVLFVETGIEQPDEVGFFHDTVRPWLEEHRRFQVHVFRQEEADFFALARRKGMLGAKDPWCRTEIKMPLKRRATAEIYGGRFFVAYEGSRRYETNYRRRYATVNVPRNYPDQIWVHPLANWTGLELWLYILAQRLPVNPVYMKGFQKTTCWCCPLVQPFHLERSRALYPELWSKLDGLKLVGFGDRDSPEIPY